LDTVPARFIDEFVGSFALDFEGYRLMPGVRVQNQGRTALSSLAVGKFQIGFGQLGDKDFGVIATFSGPDFEYVFGHLTHPVERQCLEYRNGFTKSSLLWP
jgi:hypothetical protein